MSSRREAFVSFFPGSEKAESHLSSSAERALIPALGKRNKTVAAWFLVYILREIFMGM